MLAVAATGPYVGELVAELAVEDAPQNSFDDFLASQGDSATLPDIGMPELADIVMQDSVTLAVALESMREYYRYLIQGFEHREQVFRWQFRSSWVIFGIVNLVVLVGLYFSWLQFRIGLRTGAIAAGDSLNRSGETSSQGLVTELTLSSKEIRVSSPVLGVIILVLSLAFYYLYLVYVYPIKEIL